MYIDLILNKYLFIFHLQGSLSVLNALGTRIYLRESYRRIHVAKSRCLLLSVTEIALLVTGEKQAFTS